MSSRVSLCKFCRKRNCICRNQDRRTVPKSWVRPEPKPNDTAKPKRANSNARGYNHKWRKARLTYLRREPLCVQCKADGKVVAASVVDHIVPHRGDSKLFWNTDNWQALCQRCHNRKTARGQ